MLDTHKEIKRLMHAGFTEPQAEAIVQVAMSASLSAKSKQDEVEIFNNYFKTELEIAKETFFCFKSFTIVVTTALCIGLLKYILMD